MEEEPTVRKFRTVRQELKVLKSGIQILGRAIVEEGGFTWLNTYAKGLGLLDDYNHESLDKSGISKKNAKYPDLKEYYKMVETMRAEYDSLTLYIASSKH